MQSEISKLRSALEKAGNVERRAEVAELDAATLRGQLSESQKGLIERYKKAMRAERSAISREEAAGRSDIEARRLFEDAVESISYTEKHKLVATESVVRAGLMQSESDTRVGLMSQLIHSVSGDAGPEALARLEEIIDKFGKAAKGRLEASESQMRSLESQNAEISEELDVMRAYKDMFFEEQRRNEGLTKTIKGLERQKNILERRFAEQGSGTPVRPGTNPTTPHSARRATPGASLRTPGRQ